MERWRPRREQGNNPPEQSVEPERKPLPAPELLDKLCWHIDRYDRLRASTSTRASTLLAGNAVLFTGSTVLTIQNLQRNIFTFGSWNNAAVMASTAVTILTILGSILSCINAIASRKTIRSLHPGEIPSRFLFNWGDTMRMVDGYTSFAGKVESLRVEDVVQHAIAELWTDIKQHSRRHSHLRRGIACFKYAILSFVAVISLTFWHAA